jgi:hypothetical protein
MRRGVISGKDSDRWSRTSAWPPTSPVSWVLRTPLLSWADRAIRFEVARKKKKGQCVRELDLRPLGLDLSTDTGKLVLRLMLP